MKYFSMFSGIGGFELGIETAFKSLQSTQRKMDGVGYKRDKPPIDSSDGDGGWLHPICVGYSEIDKYAIKIYERHYGNHKNYGDARNIRPDSIPDFDLLVGGFPCQAFSIAGKRRGFDDTRGTLFFEIARILKEKRPRHFLLENVKGLLSHDNGNTFKTIILTLAELGYGVEWQVLNSKNYGVPQNRERVFIIGHLGECCGRQVFPIGENDTRYFKESLTSQYTHGVLTEATQFQEPILRDGRDNRSCLRSGRTTEVGIKGASIRRLTPTECERLQGFPDGWTEGVSDSQRYKCLGNAVTVNVIEFLIRKLYPTQEKG